MPEIESSTDAKYAADATQIEKHGIDLIGPQERRGRPRDLFGMWFGTNLNIFYIVNGAVVISLGLSFVQSLIAIVLGNLAFLAVGLTSLQGPRTGTSTFAVSKASYGPHGGRGLALFNWITCVGFEASGLALVVLAILALFDKAGVSSSTGLKIVVILAAAVVQGLLPLWGHAMIVAAQRRLAVIFGVLFIIMAILVAPKLHLGALSHAGPWQDITLALALVASGGGLSWANTGSDYSRYLPRDTSAKSVFWYSTLGGFLPAVLLEALGAAVASVVDSASDPIAGVPAALPSWVADPYLVFAIFTLLAVNTMNLYSSGLTLQAIGVRLERWQCVVLDSIICTALCFVVIFSGSFNHYYSEFLGLLVVWLVPWIAIYGVDWFLRRGRYDAAALVNDGRSGRYWRRGGVHIPGVIAQLVGMVAAALWINSAAYIGPLSKLTDSSDFSVFTGATAAGVTYCLLARRSVARETAETPAEPGPGPVAISVVSAGDAPVAEPIAT